MRRDARCWLPLILALGLNAAGCSRALPEPSAHPPARAAPAVAHIAKGAQTTAASALPHGARTHTQTPDSAWLAAAREDPDPNVRLHALGAWSQYPGELLDPLTYALVDPDEAVRARAQQLMEEALARR